MKVNQPGTRRRVETSKADDALSSSPQLLSRPSELLSSPSELLSSPSFRRMPESIALTAVDSGIRRNDGKVAIRNDGKVAIQDDGKVHSRNDMKVRGQGLPDNVVIELLTQSAPPRHAALPGRA